MAACGRSDEDQTTKIKEEVGLQREEIKHFWRKILSSLRFSSVLDSIRHGLRQVNHESFQENIWKLPLEH